MNASLPLVSIITPLYRTSEKLSAECAQSVIKSTKDLAGIAEVEWLIQVDEPEIPEYLSKCKYALVESNPTNVGSAQSRNAALACSRGDIIVSVDADDIIVDLRPTVKALIEMPKIGWASGLVLTFHEDGSIRHDGVRSLIVWVT